MDTFLPREIYNNWDFNFAFLIFLLFFTDNSKKGKKKSERIEQT